MHTQIKVIIDKTQCEPYLLLVGHSIVKNRSSDCVWKIHILVMPRDHPQSYLCLNSGSPPPLPRHYLAGLARTAECCGEKLESEPHPPMCYRGPNYQNAVRILGDYLNRYHDIPPHVRTSQSKELHWSEQHRGCHSRDWRYRNCHCRW